MLSLDECHPCGEKKRVSAMINGAVEAGPYLKASRAGLLVLFTLQRVRAKTSSWFQPGGRSPGPDGGRGAHLNDEEMTCGFGRMGVGEMTLSDANLRKWAMNPSGTTGGGGGCKPRCPPLRQTRASAWSAASRGSTRSLR